MSQHKTPFHFFQACGGIDVNFLHTDRDGGHGDIHSLHGQRVGHQLEARRYAAQKGKAVQEPVPGLLDGTLVLPALLRRADPSGVIHGRAQGVLETGGENLLPVLKGEVPSGNRLPDHIRTPAAHGGKTEIGGVLMLFQPMIQGLFIPGIGWHRRGEFQRRRTEMQF